MKNLSLIKKVLQHIEKDASTWDQSRFNVCGTSHCFGGWAIVLSGAFDTNEMFLMTKEEQGWNAAKDILGLTDYEAEYYFNTARTFEELQYCVCERNMHGYDENGFDRYGYDINGYDENGFDENGYNISGYDADGYDRYGMKRTNQ